MEDKQTFMFMINDMVVFIEARNEREAREIFANRLKVVKC